MTYQLVKPSKYNLKPNNICLNKKQKVPFQTDFDTDSDNFYTLFT